MGELLRDLNLVLTYYGLYLYCEICADLCSCVVIGTAGDERGCGEEQGEGGWEVGSITVVWMEINTFRTNNASDPASVCSQVRLLPFGPATRSHQCETTSSYTCNVTSQNGTGPKADT